MSTSKTVAHVLNLHKFFESPKLVQIRIDAGVKSPNIIYLEEIEKGMF